MADIHYYQLSQDYYHLFVMIYAQIYIIKARCVTTKKAKKVGCLPAPASVGRRKIMIMKDREQ